MSLSLAELARDSTAHFDLDHAPSWAELFELGRYLKIGLDGLAIDGPDSGQDGGDRLEPLRLTKGRVRTTAICPAQVLAEVDPFAMNFNIAVGIACDAAAGVLALHPMFDAEAGWYQSLEPSLGQEHPHLVDFVNGLGAGDRADFDHVVDDLCGSLPDLLGDLRPLRPAVHQRIAHVPVPAIRLTGEVDLSIVSGQPGADTPGRILAEVKSGSFNPRISDELAHYGLIVSLQQLSAVGNGGPTDGIGSPEPPLAGEGPRALMGCAVSLGDLAVTPVPLGLDVLETAARRVLETTESLVAIDQAVADGRTPPTNPGDHCRWCRRVADCADAPDLVLAELNEILRPLDANRFDPTFDDGPFNDDFEAAASGSAGSSGSSDLG